MGECRAGGGDGSGRMLVVRVAGGARRRERAGRSRRELGKFAGTPTGDCVDASVKTVTFPPSDGVSFPYPFVLGPPMAPAKIAPPPRAEPPARIVATNRPLSFERLVTDADLEGRGADELRLMRNTIFARAGRSFEDRALREYFSRQPWYRPAARPAKLSALDEKNVRASSCGRRGPRRSKVLPRWCRGSRRQPRAQRRTIAASMRATFSATGARNGSSSSRLKRAGLGRDTGYQNALSRPFDLARGVLALYALLARHRRADGRPDDACGSPVVPADGAPLDRRQPGPPDHRLRDDPLPGDHAARLVVGPPTRHQADGTRRWSCSPSCAPPTTTATWASCAIRGCRVDVPDGLGLRFVETPVRATMLALELHHAARPSPARPSETSPRAGSVRGHANVAAVDRGAGAAGAGSDTGDRA